jgi:hypothetical protein
LHAFYATFSTDSKSYFWGKNFNHTVKALFTNNEGNTDETAEKTENLFYKCVLELNFATVNSLEEQSC